MIAAEPWLALDKPDIKQRDRLLANLQRAGAQEPCPMMSFRLDAK